LEKNGFYFVFSLLFYSFVASKKISMKRLLFLLIVLAFVIAGCGKKKSVEKDDISTVQMQKDKTGFNRMQPYKVDSCAIIKGKRYDYTIERVPCDSMAKVKSEVGDTYVDNHITLTVSCGGHTIFHRVFTKASFASYMDPKVIKASVLEGIVFDRIEGNNLIFAGSVGDPETDMYTPFVLTITSGGTLSIKEDTVMDGYDETEEDSSEATNP